VAKSTYIKDEGTPKLTVAELDLLKIQKEQKAKSEYFHATFVPPKTVSKELTKEGPKYSSTPVAREQTRPEIVMRVQGACYDSNMQQVTNTGMLSRTGGTTIPDVSAVPHEGTRNQGISHPSAFSQVTPNTTAIKREVPSRETSRRTATEERRAVTPHGLVQPDLSISPRNIRISPPVNAGKESDAPSASPVMFYEVLPPQYFEVLTVGGRRFWDSLLWDDLPPREHIPKDRSVI
jgi:hypothetical protein